MDTGLEVHGELLAVHQSSRRLMDLTPEERIFVYYMFRAGLPFNSMYRDQNHARTNDIIHFMTYLRKQFQTHNATNLQKEVETYLVYLWANHGPYFLREYANNKRTPDKIGLIDLTSQLIKMFEGGDVLAPYIFDPNVDPEMVVGDSIEKSGNNFYGKGFTEEMYQALPEEIKSSINAYPTIVTMPMMAVRPKIEFRSVYGKNGDELRVAVYWLCSALHHIMLNVSPNNSGFDSHFISALNYLIQYFLTGDEKFFKLHCIEWIKTNSRLDWTMGFIETYHDPKKIRGHAGAEITIKEMDMSKLNPVLLEMEQRIPIPVEFKRDPKSGSNINVSVNYQLHGAGDYGPLEWMAAYCLPNYDDIRSQCGSKQVIYKETKSAGELLNPELYKRMKPSRYLSLPFDTAELFSMLWDVQVILHETTGHASARFGRHISGVDITDANYNSFITKDTDALEELRAEIIALYLSVFEIDTLNSLGLFKGWYERLGREELQKWCIVEMAQHGFRRYAKQKENFIEIVGAHAKANIIIMNFLLAHEAIKIVEEPPMLSIEVINIEKAFGAIILLVQTIQSIKSTGDGLGCATFFARYLTSPVTIEMANRYRNYQETIRKQLIGNIKGTAKIYSRFTPIIKKGALVDISIDDNEGFVDQNLRFDRLMYSTELE